MSKESMKDNNVEASEQGTPIDRRNIEPYKNVIISDEKGNELIGAYLDYIGSKIAVIQLLSIWDVKLIRDKGTLYFKSLEKYDQIYRGSIEYIDGNAVFFKDFENISDELKNDLKVDYVNKTKITFLDEDDEEVVMPVVMKDISRGGVCFFTLESLKVGQILEMVLEFTKEPLPVKLEIIRRERYPKDPHYYYGCKILALNIVEESMLKQAIFRIDIENKRGKSKFEDDDFEIDEDDFEEI